MRDLEVLDSAAAATLVLDPVKSRLLAQLTSPESAASLAERLETTRQRVNYHLRILEEHGLVAPAGERRWGGLTERLFVASAASYVVSPEAMGGIGADPARSRDRLSASYLIALAARVVREVGALWRAAREREKRLATLSLDTVVRFGSPAERAAFTEELARCITELAARYHDPAAPRGREHRLVVLSYPAPADPHD